MLDFDDVHSADLGGSGEQSWPGFDMAVQMHVYVALELPAPPPRGDDTFNARCSPAVRSAI